MRTWTVYEWYCEGVIDTQFTQVIEIADNVAPTISCPEDYTISATLHECEASFLIPPAIVDDECSENLTVNISHIVQA